MMPCCIGKLHRKYPEYFRTKLGGDWLWNWDLAQDINETNMGYGDAKLTKDNRCLSPRNIVLSHVRD
jgi:hypothetical protein